MPMIPPTLNLAKRVAAHVDGPYTRMGFIPPAIKILDVTNLAIPDGQLAGVRIGKIELYPSDAKATLAANNGGTLAVDAFGYLVTTATPLDVANGASQSFTVQADWYNQPSASKAFALSVTGGGVVSIALSGAHTMASGAAAATNVGTLSSVPTGAAFTIVAQDVANAFAVSTGHLVAGSATTDKTVTPTINVTIRGTRNGLHFDQVFTITLT